MESDHRYYTRRAAEEQQRARNAVTAAARERHLELAASFADKAEQRTLHKLVAKITELSPAPRALASANGAAIED
jgi:hypothetical protein